VNGLPHLNFRLSHPSALSLDPTLPSSKPASHPQPCSLPAPTGAPHPQAHQDSAGALFHTEAPAGCAFVPLNLTSAFSPLTPPNSFLSYALQVHRAPKRTKPALVLSRILKRQLAARPRPWQRGVMQNGLECRAALGSCKLRCACPASPRINKWERWLGTARNPHRAPPQGIHGSPHPTEPPTGPRSDHASCGAPRPTPIRHRRFYTPGALNPQQQAPRYGPPRSPLTPLPRRSISSPPVCLSALAATSAAA
jgi:hypothetical protein